MFHIIVNDFLQLFLIACLFEFSELMQGKMSCLMINDIDAGLGRFGELMFYWGTENLELYQLCFKFHKFPLV